MGRGYPKVSGVLPVALEYATKVISVIVHKIKEYICVMQLHGDVSDEELLRVVKKFVGKIYQRPPLRSSVKRSLRTKEIYYIDVLEKDGRLVLMKIGCEAGTYIRKLCVPGDTEILTNEGFISIEDIFRKGLNDNIKVLSFNIATNSLEFKNIMGVQKLPAPPYLIKIVTDEGVELKLTEDHEVLVSLDEGLAWIEAKDIKENMWLLSVRKINHFKPKTITIIDLLDDDLLIQDERIKNLIKDMVLKKYGSFKKAASILGIDRRSLSNNNVGLKIKYAKRILGSQWNKIKDSITKFKTRNGLIITLSNNATSLNEKWLYLLGLIASDGSVVFEKKLKRPTKIVFHNTDKNVIDTFVMYYKDIFPQNDVSISVKKENRKKLLYEIRIYNPVLAEVAYNLGIRSPKELSDFKKVFILPENLVASFLRGYFDGDGGVLRLRRKKTNTVEIAIVFTTASKTIALRLYQLLKRLGIRSRIYRRKTGYYDVFIRNPYDKYVFMNVVGSNHSERRKKLQEICKLKVRNHIMDYMPLHVKNKVMNILKKYKLTPSSLKLGGNFVRVLKGCKPMTKHVLGRFLKKMDAYGIHDENTEELQKIFNSNIYLVKVKKVSKEKYNEEHVYDITVEDNHNFLPFASIVISNCHDIGLLLGVGAHMRELRRTRAGPFKEDESLVRLQDLADALYRWKFEGKDDLLRKYIMPMERAVCELPKIIIRDTAVDAVAHGANLAVPGIVALHEGINVGDRVAVFTVKGELVALGRANMSSNRILEAKKGIAVKVSRVIIEPGLYPRAWKSGKKGT